MSVSVKSVDASSVSGKAGIKNGDKILSINGQKIIDVLDYRFYQNERRLKIQIETKDGKVKTLKIHKGEYEDLGLEFETYLMDKQRECKNKCIFCFVDQLPEGMRKSLYFKDDDSRLSFLFGNYITLTNLTEHEINRIVKMHISPVNISVHTTNPQLRCMMMNNRFAGEALKILDRFNEANIKMNFQLVLCRGINDGEELIRSLECLLNYENALSVAAVPAGLTKYRKGLYPLLAYDKDTAVKTLEILEKYGEKSIEKYGERRIFAADEFYLLAKKDIPDTSFYEGFPQLENGVGMWSLTKSEAEEEIEFLTDEASENAVTLVTGVAAKPLLDEIYESLKRKVKNLNCSIYSVKNDFFGETITVSGLVTGGDIIRQLKDKKLGKYLYLPEVMLRYENDMFLDNVTLETVERELSLKVIPVKVSGKNIVQCMIGRYGETDG